MGFFETAKKTVKGAYEDVKGNETVKGVHTFLKERSSNIAHEMTESPAQERREHKRPPRKVAGRVPRKSQPAGYDGSYDMFGSGGGTGMSMDSDMFGVSGFGREAPVARAAPPRRRKQKSKRARAYEDEDVGMMAPGHIPSYLRHMF